MFRCIFYILSDNYLISLILTDFSIALLSEIVKGMEWKPDKVVEIPTEKELEDSPRYVPTGNIISRQVIGIAVTPVVTEYHENVILRTA